MRLRRQVQVAWRSRLPAPSARKIVVKCQGITLHLRAPRAYVCRDDTTTRPLTHLPIPGTMTAAELTALREHAGLYRAELARRLGISRSQLHNYERGRDRGTGRPCPIPLTVELACRALAGSLPAKDPNSNDR